MRWRRDRQSQEWVSLTHHVENHKFITETKVSFQPI